MLDVTGRLMAVYGLLLFCKHFVRSRIGTTAYVYPVSSLMPVCGHRTLMGFAHRLPIAYTSSRALRPHRHSQAWQEQREASLPLAVIVTVVL